MVVTAPALPKRKCCISLRLRWLKKKNAFIMNDIKEILISVTLTGSPCFLSKSISYFVIYIINEECLVIF